MKTVKLFLTCAFLFFATLTSVAQSGNTASSEAGAKIVKALTLTKTASLHFGTMSIPTGPVNIVLTTNNVRSSTTPQNITLLDQAPVAETAAYTVAGSDDATYSISLPANGVVIISNGSNRMNVDDFSARTASAGVDGLTGHLNSSGSDSFTVGATLKLENAQAYGTYSGSFDITVIYN